MIQTHIASLPSHVDVLAEFPRWVTQYCGCTSIVLDVGAGKGRTGFEADIRSRVTRLVGVDPDADIELNPYLDERYQGTIEDFAKSRCQLRLPLYDVCPGARHPTSGICCSMQVPAQTWRDAFWGDPEFVALLWHGDKGERLTRYRRLASGAPGGCRRKTCLSLSHCVSHQ